MDAIVYLKKNLISRIKSSNNETFLRALQTLFDSSEQELFDLNEAQRRSVDTGQKDIENGNYKTHKQVMEEMTLWLKKE